MKIIIFTLSLLISLSVFAKENAKKDMSVVIKMMVTAKATGMCGVFSQMVNFQQATKMPGGDEFLVRFLTTEAVRLGHTLDSFMAQCPVVVKENNANMKLLGFEQ